MPRETGVDRPTVVINMLRLTHIMPINHGERMVCLAGAGIHSVLQKYREAVLRIVTLSSPKLSPRPS